MKKNVHFCWRCGKGVGPNQKVCYYCSAPVDREIQEPRQCPFCFGEIHPKAIKCPHCGEFITQDTPGAPKTAGVAEGEFREPPVREQLIFVIPPQFSPHNQPLFLPAGEAVAEEFRRRLGQGTIRAIESGKPLLIDNPGVKALPHAEAQSHVPRALLPDGRSMPVVRGADGVIEATAKPQSSNLPALAGKGAAGARAFGGALIKAARAIGPLLNFRLPRRSKVSVSAADAAERSPTRLCVQCDTEILRADNYCYHCGFSYVKKGGAGKLPHSLINNTGLYAAIVLIFVLYLVLDKLVVFPDINENFIKLLLPLSVVLSAVGLFRKIALDSLLWLIITLGAAIYFL